MRKEERKEHNKQQKLLSVAAHREKRNKKYFDRIRTADEYNCPLSAVGKYGVGHWKDSSSPTGYSQKCDWSSICQYPCNGDC